MIFTGKILVEDWNKEIDKVTEKFIESFQAFTESQLNFKPKPNVWSIAQNMAHLILLNNSYFENFDEIKEERHLLPQVDKMHELVTESLLSLRPYASTDRPKKGNTWNKWRPSTANFDLGILANFIEHQSVFKSQINGFQEFTLNKTYIKYPGETNLVFKLDDCIDFLVEHENRH